MAAKVAMHDHRSRFASNRIDTVKMAADLKSDLKSTCNWGLIILTTAKKKTKKKLLFIDHLRDSSFPSITMTDANLQGSNSLPLRRQTFSAIELEW